MGFDGGDGFGGGLPSSVVSSGSQSSPVLFADSYCPTGSVDLSTGLQNAYAAASAIGSNLGVPVPLVLTPGRNYMLSQVVPESYVDLRGYGATISRNPTYNSNVGIFSGNAAGITDVAYRGIVMPGTGTEQAFQGVFELGQVNYLTIEDCKATGLASFFAYLVDCQWVWLERSKAINCTVQNPFNFKNGANGNTMPWKHLWVNRCVVTGWNALGIDFVSDSFSNRTDPVWDAHVTDCTVIGAVGNGGWCLGVEQGGSSSAPPNVSDFDFSGNTLIQPNTSGTCYGIVLTNDSVTPSTDPLNISRVSVRGNHITANASPQGTGILSAASRAVIEGNPITAGQHDVQLQGRVSTTIFENRVRNNPGGQGTGNRVNVFGSNVDTTTLYTDLA